MPDQTKSNEPGAKDEACRDAKCDCPLCSLREFLSQQADSEVWQHFSRAQEEFLLGVRAIVDGRLEKMKSKPQKKEPRVTKVKMD